MTGAKYCSTQKISKKKIQNLQENPPDIVHCHDADTLSVGLSLKSKLGTDLVFFDMHDLAHTWAKMEKPYSIIRRLVSTIIERRLIRRIKKYDLIVTSSGAVFKSSHPDLENGFEEE